MNDLQRFLDLTNRIEPLKKVIDEARSNKLVSLETPVMKKAQDTLDDLTREINDLQRTYNPEGTSWHYYAGIYVKSDQTLQVIIPSFLAEWTALVHLTGNLISSCEKQDLKWRNFANDPRINDIDPLGFRLLMAHYHPKVYDVCVEKLGWLSPLHPDFKHPDPIK